MKTLTSVLTVPLLVLALLTTGHACTCTEDPSPSEAFAASDVVFTGRVASIELIDPYGQGWYEKIVSLEKLDCWKGVLEDTVVVRTGFDEGVCGYEFQVAEEYLVYAVYAPSAQDLYTGICTRTQALAWADADLDALGEPTCTVSVESISWAAVKNLYHE